MMEIDDHQIDIISENYIKLLKFPYKLWIAVNSETNQAIKWTHYDDTTIFINIVLLKTYLCSTGSIFKVNNVNDFNIKLINFGFTQCEDQNIYELILKNYSSTDISILKIYKNYNFNKNNYELIENMKKLNSLDKDYDDILPIIREINQVKKIKLDNENKTIDPCCSKINKLPKLQESRIILKTLVQVELNQGILNERVFECDHTVTKDELPLIQLPADVFENASESVSEFVEKTEYAGFYGNAINFVKVKEFFDEYLPVYVHTNEEDEMTVNGDNKSTGEIEGFRPEESLDFANCGKFFPESLDNTEFSSLLNYSTDELHSKAVPLEPIFAEDEENDPNNEDITMDEYLKFNKNDDSKNQIEQQIDENDKTEEQNEDHFKNFFNQYRDSMSVLYET